MENNYKEFLQKIKYMVEYDTSKTREENTLLTEGYVYDPEYTITWNFAGKVGDSRDSHYEALDKFKEFLSKEDINFEQRQTKYIDLEKNVDLKKVVDAIKGMGLSQGNDFYVDQGDKRLDKRDISEGEEVTKKVWDGMSDDEREEALLTVFSDPDDAAQWIEAKYDDLPPHVTHMEINEGVITEEDTPKLKGIEEAQKIINKIRAKHKNDKNWDEFIGWFVERINDAFNVNEGEEVNELMSKTTQDGWDEKTSSVMSEDEMELMKVAKELVNLFKSVGMNPALMSPAGKVIGDSNGDLWIQVQENPQRESEMWISFRTSNPTSDLNKFGPSILSKFKNVKLIRKDGDSMSLGLK